MKLLLQKVNLPWKPLVDSEFVAIHQMNTSCCFHVNLLYSWFIQNTYILQISWMLIIKFL